jgi:ribonuclease HI
MKRKTKQHKQMPSGIMCSGEIAKPKPRFPIFQTPIPTSFKLICFFDGACEPKNPGGNMGWGWHVSGNGNEIFEYSNFLPADHDNSNNVAEYLAFEELLDFLFANGLHQQHHIEIYGDSKLVINQMFSNWQMHGGYYVPVAQRCLKKLSLFNRRLVSGQWVPRTKNNKADELSKRELIKHNVEFRIQPNEYR